MGSEMDPALAAEMVAMQFAGGESIARLCASWERDAEWVETAIRLALLASIPRREGGMKPSRTEMREARRMETYEVGWEQPRLEFDGGRSEP